MENVTQVEMILWKVIEASFLNSHLPHKIGNETINIEKVFLFQGNIIYFKCINCYRISYEQYMQILFVKGGSIYNVQLYIIKNVHD